MTIKKKLILFMLIAILLSSAVIITTNRMVTTREIQNITRNDLGDMVNTAYHLIRISPALDIKKLQNVFNKDLKIGRTGFLFVVNTKGELVVHKKAQGQNWKNKPHIKHIINARSGYLRYLSPKTKTYKVAVYRHYAPLNWIIVASNFEGDALDAPLANMAKRSIQMLVPAMIVLCLLFIFFLSRTVVKPITSAIAVLSNGAGHVASTSEHIASASQQLAEGATEQAAAIEETSASLEEKSSMTKQNADNAGQADGLMQKTTKVVASANDSMGRLTGSMADISTASEETSKIIKTIDEIAFQTNLLALNAAVEAARAGEAGAGFAVVADEVRNLAMRAADAAKNTAVLIEDTVEKVGEGSTLVETTNADFANVSESAFKVGELVSEIAAASIEQAEGIEQVNRAVVEMDKVVQQNAASAEESASAAEEMNAQAEEMSGIVSEVKALTGATGEVRKNEVNHTKAVIAGSETPPAKMAPATAKRSAGKFIPLDEEDGDFKDF